MDILVPPLLKGGRGDYVNRPKGHGSQLLSESKPYDLTELIEKCPAVYPVLPIRHTQRHKLPYDFYLVHSQK